MEIKRGVTEFEGKEKDQTNSPRFANEPSLITEGTEGTENDAGRTADIETTNETENEAEKTNARTLTKTKKNRMNEQGKERNVRNGNSKAKAIEENQEEMR